MGEFSSRGRSDRRAGTLAGGALVMVAALLAGLLTVTGTAPASAATLGPGRPSVPGFVGYVTRTGGELGLGRLGDGRLGVCIDTGSQHGWPAGTPSARLVTNPRVGFVMAKYVGTARGNARAAAALWWLVGKDFGLNSHAGAMRSLIDVMRSESPGIYGDVKAWHDRMLADANHNAPAAAGYDARTLELEDSDPARGRVSGIGVKGVRRQWVTGYPVTVTLTGATFDATGRATWTGTTGRAARSLSWTQTLPGKVTVKQVVTGLPNNRYRVHDAHDGTQRVVTAAASESVTGADSLASDEGWARVRKVDAASGAGLASARFRAWSDLDADKKLDSGEDNALLTSGPAGWTARFRTFRGLLVCFEETQAPSGFVLNPAPSCVKARRGSPSEASVADERLWNPQVSTRISSELVEVGTSISDAVRVTETGGATIPGEWTLLGPLPPVAGRCTALDWSRAPVSASGTFTATDDVFTVGSYSVLSVGCFTYQERLKPTRTTTEVPWTTAGIVAETTLVKSRPWVATQINSQHVTAGASLVDLVSVSATFAATITGGWRLLGPVAPNRDGGCEHRDWTEAPIAAQGRFTVHGDGSLFVGRHEVTVGGCFTYAEQLGATSTTTATSWTRPGIITETALVRPKQPWVPAHPTIPSGGESASSDRLLRGLPSAGRVDLPGVGLRASLSPVRFVGSALTPPSRIRAAGIWAAGAPLDAVVGSTVMVGHVSDNHGRPGEFGKLAGARPGQRITTRAGDGSKQLWRVERVWLAPRARLPRSIFFQRVSRHLVLVTCARKVMTPQGGFHYSHNLIIDATPIRHRSR